MQDYFKGVPNLTHIQVIKKNGSTQMWDPSKIMRAVDLAAKRSKENLSSLIMEDIISFVNDLLPDNLVHVNDVHKLVENALMHYALFDTAREYIQYRHSNKPDIFKKREAILPYEYPEILDFVKAIRDSYWVHTHFTWDTDIGDFNNPQVPQYYKECVHSVRTSYCSDRSCCEEVLGKHRRNFA